MPLKTKEQYIESLRDNREIYWNGEKITDITTHPRFRKVLKFAATDYDYDDPKYGELRKATDEDGNVFSHIFKIPRNAADLRRRVEYIKHTTVGTLPTQVYSALLSAKDAVAKIKPEYAANIERCYLNARDNDLRACETITDAKGDRKRRAHEQDDPDLYVRIVERRKDGIVVRGAKLHISGASIVHELVVMPTKGMKAEESDYAVSFCIPVATPGVKIINRSTALDDFSDFDFPASATHAAPEGFVIFDDVFVPWDRVFLAGEVELASVLARSLGLWERSAGLIEYVRISQWMVGLGQLVTEMQGKDKDPIAQASIAELISYHEILKMSLDYACEHYETTESGMVHPNTLASNVARYYYGANWHQTVRYLHDLGGGLVITLPHEADLRNEESGKYIRKYLHTKPDVDVETRMRVYNLIRDLTADAYGGWQFVVALQAGGGLSAMRFMMKVAFDMEEARRVALVAAGALPE